MSGRIEGRMSADRAAYELVQGGTVRETIPIVEAHANEKLKKAIQRNKWQELR